MKVDGVMETMVNKQPVEPVMPVIDESALPDGWALKTIGEVCEKAEKVDPTANPDAEFRYIDIGGIDNQLLRIVDAKTYLGKDAPSRARQLVKANDVVISTVRTYLKNIALVPDDLDGQVASTGFCVLRSSDMWMGKYLYYFVQSDAVLKEIGKQQRGTSYPAVRDSDIKAQFIPVPPKREVRRIVEAIELQLGRLDAAVARLQGAKARLKRYKQAVLKAAFAETESGFDDGWQELTIGDVARRIVVGYVGPMTEFIVESDGIPLLSTTHIGENEFLDKESRQVTRAFHEKNKKSRVAPGDILIARHGDSGKACIVPGHVMEAQVSNAVILSVDSASALPEYVCYRINFERTVMQEARVGGVLQVVNTKTMEAFPLRVPSLESQRRIVERVKQQLAATDETEATLDAQLQQAVRLRQAVLKRAFEGRLG